MDFRLTRGCIWKNEKVMVTGENDLIKTIYGIIY
jgi:hypothetical protein